MPKLAANLSTLFKEHGFLERFAAARGAGFRAVEYQYPYEFSAADVAAAAREAGVEVVLHNLPRGDVARGEHGIACLPGREAEFRESLERAVEYARAAGCRSLHCLAGVMPAGADRARLRATYLANLELAAQRLRRERMRLLIEPVSEATAANYFLRSSAQAIGILEELGADNAFLQYDLFHMQVMEGNLAATIARPALVLYDEPTAGLDPVTTQKMYDLLAADQEETGCTVVAVSSDVKALMAFASHVALIHEGSIRYAGASRDILEAADELVRQFVTGSEAGPL